MLRSLLLCAAVIVRAKTKWDPTGARYARKPAQNDDAQAEQRDPAAAAAALESKAKWDPTGARYAVRPAQAETREPAGAAPERDALAAEVADLVAALAAAKDAAAAERKALEADSVAPALAAAQDVAAAERKALEADSVASALAAARDAAAAERKALDAALAAAKDAAAAEREALDAALALPQTQPSCPSPLEADVDGAAPALEFRPLGPALGLEVVGLRRRDIGRDETSRALRRAFAASRGLLLVRGLEGLAKDEMVALASTFGAVEASPADGAYESLLDGDARVHAFSTVPSSEVFRGETPADWRFDEKTGRPSWHTDQSFRSPRPRASCMYCVASPPDGVGRTVFASTVAALEDAPAPLRARLEGLRCAHSYAYLADSFARYSRSGGAALSASRKATLRAPAVHALCEGDALYLAPHVVEAVLDDRGVLDGSRDVVDGLAAHATRAAYVHEHWWRPGDFVVWNNLRTMHAATEVPPERAGERLMWRATMLDDGDGPLDAGWVRVSVTASAARALAVRAFAAAGSAAGQAAAAAAALVAAEVDGKPAHGLRRAAEICDALARGDVAAAPAVAATVRGGVVRVDGGGGLAFEPLRAAAAALASLAGAKGAAVAAITNTRSISGRLGPTCERLAADHGLVAVAVANTPAYLAAPGAGDATRVLGTNPVAYAAPRGRGEPPVVVDLALAASSRAAIEVAATAGAPLAAGVAVDARGEPTVDAAEALESGAQLPVGGTKGALLCLLVEILAGALTGSELAVDSDDYNTMNRGLLLLALDPGATSSAPFDARRLFDAFGGRGGEAARRSRAAKAAGGDHAIAVAAPVFYDLQRRARATPDHASAVAADLARLPLDG